MKVTTRIPSWVTLPGTAIAPLARVILVAFRVVTSIGSSKVMVISVSIAINVAPEAGTIETTAGGMFSMIEKLQALVDARGLPDESRNPGRANIVQIEPFGRGAEGVNVAIRRSGL